MVKVSMVRSYGRRAMLTKAADAATDFTNIISSIRDAHRAEHVNPRSAAGAIIGALIGGVSGYNMVDKKRKWYTKLLAALGGTAAGAATGTAAGIGVGNATYTQPSDKQLLGYGLKKLFGV